MISPKNLLRSTDHAEPAQLYRILDNKTKPFHSQSHLENNKEMCTFQHSQKKMLFVSQ